MRGTSLMLAILLGVGVTTAYGAQDLPRPQLGCARIGDAQWEDVWDFCPSGRVQCRRWAGYFGFGSWKSCYHVGMPPAAPCTWSTGTSSWICDGGKSIACTHELCE
jgi:hypothetical protein